MTKQLGVIFIKRSGFEFVGSNLPSVVSFPFPPALIAAQEVLDKEKTIEAIGTFIQTNKIVPIHLLMLLSGEVLFEKYTSLPQTAAPTTNPQPPSVTQGTPSTAQAPVAPAVPKLSEAAKKDAELQEALEEEKIVQRFLANIPFENIAAKKYKTAKGPIIVATNNDLFTAVKEAFETNGFFVEAVVPAFIFDEAYHTLADMSPEIALAVETKADMAKQNDLLFNPEMIKSMQTTEKTEQVQTQDKPNVLKKNLRVFVLIGVFFILLIVLGLVLYLSSRDTAPVKKRVPKPVSSNTPLISPSPTLATASSSAALAKTLNIVITKKVGDGGSAESVKTLLVSGGFLNTTIAPTINTSATNNTLLFAPSVPNEIREEIIAIVHKNFPETTIAESTETTPDVSIIIGSK